MSLLTKLRYVPKRFGMVAAVITAVAVPAVLFAWGPSRPTYTVAHPADHITFNSITDNPNVGDERNFVVVKDAANTAEGGWQDNVTVAPGKEYLVRMYVHNNAATQLNLTALNTRVTAAIGTNTGKSVSLTGYVSADNALPTQVYDDASFSANNNFNIAYVAGSAMIYNNATGQAGRAVSDSIVNGSGAQIGYAANDGKVPGCFQYASYVTFKVKPQFQETANFTLTKDVRKSGTTTYGQTAAVAPGDKVDYRISFKNAGAATLNNVVIKDQLPAGVSYVAGTAKLQNANYQYPNTFSLSDTMFKTGVNIGTYTKDANAFVTFQAQVAGNDSLPVCGPNTLRNVASAETDAGSVSDDAIVTTNKTCVPTDNNIQVCRLADKQIVTIKESQFDASKYSKNLDDCKTVPVKDIQVCRLADKQIVTIKENEFDVAKYSKNLDDCKEVPVKNIEVCRLADKTIVTIKESEFDAAKYSKNLDDCKDVPVVKIEVCRLSDKQIVKIDESEFDAAKYSKNLDDCKTVPVTQIDVCRLADKQIVKINESDFDASKYSKNLDDCKETPVVKTVQVCNPANGEIITVNESEAGNYKPVNDASCVKTPPTLPSTGPEALLGGLFGSSALGLGITSYVRSRRAIRDAINK